MTAVLLKALRTLNGGLEFLTVSMATGIVAIMVSALCGSALTRFVSGNGYDWFIELPPALVPWLVFPILGPLMRRGAHIQVDLLPAIISRSANIYLQFFCYLTALFASVIFFLAGLEATTLFKRMGQMMELELDVPLWWMYLAFPVGFVILGLFSLELLLETARKLASLKKGEAV